jgi:dTDP-4-amino-4,6-dideoxygalactose transaminase
MSDSVLRLPLFYEMSDNEVQYVIEQVYQFYRS